MTSVNGNVFCTRCGTRLQAGDLYCTKCGTSVSAQGPASIPPNFPPKDWRELKHEARLERKAERHGLTLGAPSTMTVVEKEVVKVPCKYCGTLAPITGEVNKCPSCNAPITV